MCLLYGKCHVHSSMHVKDNLQQILMKEQHFVRIGRWWPVSRQKYAILSTHFLFNQNSHQKDTVIFSSLDSYALVNWLLLDISEIFQYSSFFRTKSFSIYTCTCCMYFNIAKRITFLVVKLLKVALNTIKPTILLSEINRTECRYKTHILVSDSTRFYNAKWIPSEAWCIAGARTSELVDLTYKNELKRL